MSTTCLRAVRRAVRAFISPRCAADIDRTIRLIEVVTGRRPFRYVDDVDASSSAAGGRMRLCGVGCSFAALHFGAMWLSMGLLFAHNRDVVLSIAENPLSVRATTVRIVLIIVETMVVIVVPFAFRQHELHVRRWERRLRRHLEAIGVLRPEADGGAVSGAERRMVRQRGRIVRAGSATVALVMVCCFAHANIFLLRALAEAQRPYAPLYSGAMVLPQLYIQLGWVQFCVWLRFQRHWADEMVAVMEAVLRGQRVEVWRQRRIRF